jgi:rSAM/selenodomain-associated transferase 2
MAIEVTIVVPVLSDADALRQLLAQVEPRLDVEVVVVDGAGDSDLDAVVATRPGTRLIHHAPGRARQMNAGAAMAAGRWLWFVHADSQLPAAWQRTFRADNLDAVGGWFRFALDDRAWQARLIERLVAWRVRLLRLPYGDQGFFVRRDVFERLGGFRDLDLMEDVEFVRRLVRTGRVVEVPLPLYTSSRRWRRDGWFRRSVRNSTFVALYFAGVSPARLARWYARP